MALLGVRPTWLFPAMCEMQLLNSEPNTGEVERGAQCVPTTCVTHRPDSAQGSTMRQCAWLSCTAERENGELVGKSD